MLEYVRDWNTHSKHSYIAQRVLNLILCGYQKSVLFDIPGINALFDSLISYSKRHYEHSADLMKTNQIIGYAVSCMDITE